MEKITMSAASMSRQTIEAYLRLYLKNEEKSSRHKGLIFSIVFLFYNYHTFLRYLNALITPWSFKLQRKSTIFICKS